MGNKFINYQIKLNYSNIIYYCNIIIWYDINYSKYKVFREKKKRKEGKKTSGSSRSSQKRARSNKRSRHPLLKSSNIHQASNHSTFARFCDGIYFLNRYRKSLIYIFLSNKYKTSRCKQFSLIAINRSSY